MYTNILVLKTEKNIEKYTVYWYVQRDLDVPSSSVPKKYQGNSNMAEFRRSSSTPILAVLEPRIYISNSYCTVIILVHVLVVRTKYQHKYDTNITLIFQRGINCYNLFQLLI